MTQEEQRLEEDRRRKAYWRRWGSYLSERQWGTVREDYSPDGEAWDYFTLKNLKGLRKPFRLRKGGCNAIYSCEIFAVTE